MPIPPATFEVLVISLHMQAQMAMEPEGDLRLARHSIDMLAMLESKTKGNLSLEEQRLIENTLTELRFRYVQAVEEHNRKAAEAASAEKVQEAGADG